MTCYGVHDYTPTRNGKQRCQRCGYEYPPIWAWWAKDDPPDTGHIQHRGTMTSIHTIIADHLNQLVAPDDIIAEINAIRRTLHIMSPLKHHPIDLIEWVPAETVTANDYNPNSVAPPEMELLHKSVAADGYTQPIVTTEEDGQRVVIDGFHRNRVGKEYPDVAETLMGYLPVVQIRDDVDGRNDRIASTIRHNRARGKHSVVGMTDVVLELKRRNWSDNKISKELGMDPDEVLRLTQIGGLAEAFADRDFSLSWDVTDDDDLIDA